MKKILALILAFAMLVPMATTVFASELYSDVAEEHWAYENIKRVSDKKWFGGYPDGTFKPQNSITRAEALKVFDVFLGLEVVPVTTSSYYDVDISSWYSPYVEAGKELLPERTSIQGKIPFQPDMPITREDAMYALVKALGYDSKTKLADQSVLEMFSDKNSISSNVKAYVAVAVTEGLVSGHSDGTIGAQDPLTRAEFATLLYRASFVGFNVTEEATLKDVSVEPSVKKELKVGESFLIKATATYSDGTTKEYENVKPYNSDDNGVVSINENTVTALKAGVCEIHFSDDNLKDKSIVVIVSENEEEKKEEEKKEDGKAPVAPDGKEEKEEETTPAVPDDKEEEKEEPVVPDDKEEEKVVENSENYCLENAVEIELESAVKDSINFSIDEGNLAKMTSRWYKINMPSPGTVAVTLLSEEMASTVTICSANGDAFSHRVFTPNNTKSFTTKLMDGTFYIRVQRDGTKYGEFALYVKTTLEDTEGWSKDEALKNGWSEDVALAGEMNKEYTPEKLDKFNYYYCDVTGKVLQDSFVGQYYKYTMPSDGIFHIKYEKNANDANTFLNEEETSRVVNKGDEIIVPVGVGYTMSAYVEEAAGMKKEAAVEIKFNTTHKAKTVALNKREAGYWAKFNVPFAGYVAFNMSAENYSMIKKLKYTLSNSANTKKHTESLASQNHCDYYCLTEGDYYIFVEYTDGVSDLRWGNKNMPEFEIRLDFSTEPNNKTELVEHTLKQLK